MNTALITGCNRGLGKQLLIDFSQKGYDIVTLTRKPSDEFDSFCKELSKNNAITISHLYADISEEKEIEAAMTQLEDIGIEVDVLINNAGVNTKAAPIFYMDYQDVLTALKINYLAPFLITKHIASQMIRKGRGSIIDITSTVSINVEPGESAYGASKAALNLSIQSMAQELAPFGVRINGIACGIMDTGMYQEFDEKLKKKFLKRIALKRPAGLNEISEMALFLASEKSSYITGSIIKVDGGFV